ncbi:MAG: hypothetical protein LRY71_03515 [Bacillaceae bacterium]|nr:hypothetical protein [Bacillaceae bacterium]
MLDDALIGQLIKSQGEKLVHSIPEKQKVNKNGELFTLMLDLKRITTHSAKLTFDPIIEKKLTLILSQIEPIVPDFHLLDIEDRHIIKRMLKDDIPKLLHSFLSLTIQQQLEQKEKVFIALSRMELKLISLKKELEKMRLEKIEHLLKLNEYAINKKRTSRIAYIFLFILDRIYFVIDYEKVRLLHE